MKYDGSKDIDKPTGLRGLVERLTANLSEISYMATLAVLVALGIAATRIGEAMVLGGLILLIGRLVMLDLKAERVAREAAEHRAAHEAEERERNSAVLGQLTALITRDIDICSRPNTIDTFRHMTRSMKAYRPRFPIEAWVAAEGHVIVNGAAINAIVEMRCRRDTPFVWTIALPWAPQGQLLFGETERERQRIAATLLAIKAIAGTRPGSTTEHLTVWRLPEEVRDHTTVLLTYHEQLQRELLVKYYADSDGFRPGTGAPPRDVILDPRTHEVRLFGNRWAAMERSPDTDKVTLDEFLTDALPLLDRGVYIDMPRDPIVNGDHLGIVDPDRICLHSPASGLPVPLFDDRQAAAPPWHAARREAGR